MASSKVLAASFVLMLFTFKIAQAQSPVGGDAAAPSSPSVSPLPQPKPSPLSPQPIGIDCRAECWRICWKTRRTPILCKRKCNICCGFSLAEGYANLTTKDIVRKCP